MPAPTALSSTGTKQVLHFRDDQPPETTIGAALMVQPVCPPLWTTDHRQMYDGDFLADYDLNECTLTAQWVRADVSSGMSNVVMLPEPVGALIPALLLLVLLARRRGTI